MKTILFTSIFILISINSKGQSRFCIDISQDLTSSHVKYSDFKTANPGFNFGSTSISASYSYNRNGAFYFEPMINFSVLADSTDLRSSNFQESINPDTLSVAYSQNILLNQYSIGANAGTRHYSVGFNLMNKVSDYFYIGGGVNFTFYKSIISDQLITEGYYHDGSNYVLASRTKMLLPYSRTTISLSVPIVLRAYLPMNKHALRFSLIGHLSTKARLEASIGFCF